jgi:small subunit ribosomal protein S3Ae
MAVGKNKRLSKGKKGKGKKIVDPFTKKEWYDIKAPSNFTVRSCGKTPVTRTAGTKIASEQLKGRVFELNLADLNKDEDHHFRKFRLQCEEVQGRFCLTQFYGMDFTTDKLRSLVRKWQSLIEAFVDVKTADGYVMRLFCIGFTKKRQNQLKKTCYANGSQQKLIRKKMRDIMTAQATSCELQELVNKFIPEVIGKEIEKACHGVYPLQNVHIRKVKMLKKPKFDLTKLLDIHGDNGLAPVGGDDKGEEVKVADLGEGIEQKEVVGA